MTCGSCGANIADKAIVCYRCGTATAAAAPPERRPAAKRSLAGVVIGAALTAAGVALAASTTVTGRMALGVGIVVAAVGLFVLWRSR